MDGFQAAVSIIALVELSVKVAKFIRDVKKTAGTVVEELDNILSEIDSIRNVSKLIADLISTFKSPDSQLDPDSVKRLKDLDSGLLIVVQECDAWISKIGTIAAEIRAPLASGNRNRLNSLHTVRRSHSREDEVQRLHQNIRAGQSRLQAFYLTLAIIQERANNVSMKEVSDKVSMLEAELKSLIAQIKQHNSPANSHWPGGLLPVETLLGSVKFNKEFDVPRSVGAFFVGRQRLLQELKDAFDQSRGELSGSPKVFVIHGFPGSGKTDFAIKYAEQYRESYWGVFVMQADSHDLMVNSFKRIVQFADKKTQPSMAAAKHWLANQELPWLLIMDNADDPELDLRSYFPASSSGCILVTTRHRDFRIHGNVGKGFFSFERLRPDEAKTVLLRAADEPKPTPKVDLAASHISERLGCLPLALVSAGKTIRTKLCGWKDYLDWYRKNCDLVSRRLQTGSGLKEVDIVNLTVIPILEPHLARLERLNDRASTDAIDLIHTLGYFHHRNISFKLLKLVAKNANKAFIMPKDEGSEEDESNSEPPKPFKVKAFEATIRMISSRPALPDVLRNTTTDTLDDHRLRAALSKLESLNLIRCDDARSEDDLLSPRPRRQSGRSRSRSRPSDDESGSDYGESQYTYSLHPLVHSWVRQRHSNIWKKSIWCEAANNALAQCIVLEAKAFAVGASSASSYFDAGEILPHISHARMCKAQIDMQLQQRALDTGWFRKSIGLLCSVPADPALLTKMNNSIRSIKYSLVYSSCGDFQKAAELQSQVRSFVVARRGMNDRISIYITLALASTMQWLSEFGKATELLSEAVKACVKVFGPDHPQTLTMIDQYGLLLLYHGRLHECTNSHQEAFNGFTKLGPKYKRQALIAKAHLGAVRAKYLKFTESRDICQEAVTGLTDLDPNDDEILWAKEALALAYAELDDGPKAYELMKDVHAKRELALGKQHPFTLWAAVNQSRALWKMKRYDDALPLLNEAREAAEITLDKQHFGYLASGVLLACILRDQGQYEEAEKLFVDIENTYKEIKQARGTDHADRIIAMGYHLELFEMQERYQDAIQIGREMLDGLRTINKEGLGWQHPLRQKISDKVANLEALQMQNFDAEETTVTAQDGLRHRAVVPSTRIERSPDPQTRKPLMRFHSVDLEQ